MHRARFCNSCVFRQARSGSMPTRIINMCRRFPRSTESARLSFLREPPLRFGSLRVSVLLSFVKEGLMAARNIKCFFLSLLLFCVLIKLLLDVHNNASLQCNGLFMQCGGLVAAASYRLCFLGKNHTQSAQAITFLEMYNLR